VCVRERVREREGVCVREIERGGAMLIKALRRKTWRRATGKARSFESF